MKDANQIAAEEAWKQITDYADTREDAIGDLAGDTNCIRFIQSAIENANYRILAELGGAKATIESLKEQLNLFAKRLDWLLSNSGRTWIYWRGERKPPRPVTLKSIDAAMRKET